MKDEIVSFETAKLAKENEFKLPCHSYYFEDGEFKEYVIEDTYGYYGSEYTVKLEELYNNWNDKMLTNKSGNRCFGCKKGHGYFETYSAPTQSLLQKWLREEHNISISIETSYQGGSFLYEIYIWKEYKDIPIVRCYRKYEHALERGLKEALKLL